MKEDFFNDFDGLNIFDGNSSHRIQPVRKGAGNKYSLNEKGHLQNSSTTTPPLDPFPPSNPFDPFMPNDPHPKPKRPFIAPRKTGHERIDPLINLVDEEASATVYVQIPAGDRTNLQLNGTTNTVKKSHGFSEKRTPPTKRRLRENAVNVEEQYTRNTTPKNIVSYRLAS